MEDGNLDGDSDGLALGVAEGAALGVALGVAEGVALGVADGASVVGFVVGGGIGAGVGTGVGGGIGAGVGTGVGEAGTRTRGLFGYRFDARASEQSFCFGGSRLFFGWTMGGSVSIQKIQHFQHTTFEDGDLQSESILLTLHQEVHDVDHRCW